MRTELMSGEEFKKFFDDVVNAAIGAKGAPESLLEVMKKHDMSPELPAPLADKIMPLLQAKIREERAAKPACGWCPVCGMCAACGLLNAGSLGALSASVLTVLR